MLLQAAVEAFGQRLGLPELNLRGDEPAALDIQDVGRLYVEINQQDGQEELLLYLARDVPAHDRDLPRRALAFCHYQKAHPFPLWCGLHKDQLVILTRFNEREATGERLENAALYLMDSLNQLFGGN